MSDAATFMTTTGVDHLDLWLPACSRCGWEKKNGTRVTSCNLEVVSLDTKFEVVFQNRMLDFRAGKQFYGTNVDLESLGGTEGRRLMLTLFAWEPESQLSLTSATHVDFARALPQFGLFRHLFGCTTLICPKKRRGLTVALPARFAVDARQTLLIML